MKILNLLLLLLVLSCNGSNQKEKKITANQSDNLKDTFYKGYLHKIVKINTGAGVHVYYSSGSPADIQEVVTNRLNYGRDSLTLEDKALINEILKQSKEGEPEKLLSMNSSIQTEIIEIHFSEPVQNESKTKSAFLVGVYFKAIDSERISGGWESLVLQKKENGDWYIENEIQLIDY